MTAAEPFDEDRLLASVELLREAVAAREVPGAVLAVGVGPRTVCSVEAGHLGTAADAPAVRTSTPFDLASLTKVVATLPAVLCLVEAGEVHLKSRVDPLLPAFGDKGARREVTIESLLTHTSGLPSHREYFRQLRGRLLSAAACREELESPPGSAVRYSDVGFIVLGEVVAAVTGRPFEDAVRELVFEPLGMRATGFCPPPAVAARTALTTEPETGRPAAGEVHDENCAALGGVSGHAGLFGEAGDLARYLAAWAAPGVLVGEELWERALSCQTHGLGGHRGLGWVRRGDPYDHMGRLWPPSAVGHTGFTGTSLALDPVSGIWLVLLTNAVHLGRGRAPIMELRRRLHDSVASAVDLPGWAGSR